jgi:hypothetical protein
MSQELTAPDLWAELAAQQEALGAGEPALVENTPFTEEERKVIEARLAEAMEYVRQTHELSAEQHAALKDRLDYLVEAADRLPRLDWRNALLGVLFGQVVQAILPAEVVRDVVVTLGRTLGPLFGVEMPELPSG